MSIKYYIHKPWLDYIIDGIKTIECIPGDKFKSWLGKIVTFFNDEAEVKVKIMDVKFYESLDEIFNDYPFEAILPGIGSVEKAKEFYGKQSKGLSVIKFRITEETAITRNNTNFPMQITNLLTDFLKTKGEKERLFYYQLLVPYYFLLNIAKGICIWHHMGSGKTKTALAIAEAMIKKGYSKILFVAPGALQENLDKEIDEYNELMGSNLDKSVFTYIKRSFKMVENISKNETKGEFKIDYNKFATNVSSIKGKTLVIIDEMHLIMQSISNGSPNAVAFYDLLMRSPNIRIVGLTGTILTSRPFEAVPMFNILSGNLVFPENEHDFLSAFWSRTEKKMLHKYVFQNRILGLVSRIDADAIQITLDEVNSGQKLDKATKMAGYPEQKETKVLNIPMSGRQIDLYFIRREKEIKEANNRKQSKGGVNSSKFAKSDKKSSTYRVRTRQCSNYAPPPEIENLYNSEFGYTQKDIDRVMDTATPDELASTKFIQCNKIMNEFKGFKGVIYSMFTDIGGNGALSRFLQVPRHKRKAILPNYETGKPQEYEVECSGYQLLKFDSDGNPTNLGPTTFAMLNRSLPEWQYNKIKKIYNDPNNDYGEKLPYLLIGLAEALGLDLKCGRFLIMMEPYFIYSLFMQLLYRVIRIRAHERFPPNLQNVQPFVLIATYPDSYDSESYIKSQAGATTGLTEDQLKNGLEFTTDQEIYKLMLGNRNKIAPFEEAIQECSIECSILKRIKPEMQCRMCAPDNTQLYTQTKDVSLINKNINYDIIEGDPCKKYEQEKIKATKITIKSDDGEELNYFYVPDEFSPSGYSIYYFNESKKIYEELFPSSPVYQTVLKMIK